MHFKYIIRYIFIGIGLIVTIPDKAFSQCATIISAFPYSEDFESGSSGWTSGGIGDDWTLGTPMKPIINSAGSGNQCWISGGVFTPFYNYGERSWVQSPCFDFTNLNYPVVSLKIFWELENQYDGGNLQCSQDGGISWQTIGNSGEADNCINQNWYTIRNVTNLSSFANPAAGWSGTVQPSNGSCRGGNGLGEWRDAIHCVSELRGLPSVMFRITMGSGTTCNDYDGLAFDLFRITESQAVPFTLSTNCVGNNQIQFKEDMQTCHDEWTWDFGDPNSLMNTSTDVSPVHEFSGPGTYTVTLSAGSACIPPANATMSIEILDVKAEVRPVTCAEGNDGEATAEVLNPPPGINYSWDTDPIQSTAIANSLKAGSYHVTVSAPSFCNSTLIVDVPYGPDAFPSVSLGADTVVCPGIPVLVYPGMYASYLWQDGSVDSVLVVKDGMQVSVEVKNAAGCKASDTLNIEEDCLGDIVFPNAFTPNEDGLNDLFFVAHNQLRSFELTIFDRWGHQIFYTQDPDENWNGKINGVPLKEGIYIAKIVYTLRDGTQIERLNRLALIR